MNTLMSKMLIGVLSLTALIGCNQNPYTSSMKPGQRIVTENTPNGQEIPRVYSIEGPSVVECIESKLCEAEFIGHVPSPGRVIYKVSGLPKGATFDLNTGKFSFTPGFDYVDVSAHPEQVEVVFDFVVTVMSSLDNSSSTSWPVTGLVKNTLQPATVVVNGSTDMNEGTAFTQTIDVNSLDFPKGPFSVNVLKGPEGVKISPVSGNPKQFKVSFTPQYSTVNFNQSGSTTKNLLLSLNFGTPLGQIIERDINWTVHDVRMDALITTPEKITQDLDVLFAIRAEDLNGEVVPTLTVNPNTRFGRITTMNVTETSAPGANPSKIVVVKWDQLNAAMYGTTTPIQYEVCVKKASGSSKLCTPRKVEVTLKKGARSAVMLVGGTTTAPVKFDSEQLSNQCDPFLNHKGIRCWFDEKTFTLLGFDPTESTTEEGLN